MKNKAKIVLIVLMAAALSGCFEVSQHVTRDSSGDVVTFVRFTFQKALFSLVEQMGGEPVDYAEMLDEADLQEGEFLDSLPAGVEGTYELVDTAASFGFNVEMRMGERQARAPFRSVADVKNDDDALENAFFPYLYRDGLAIPFEGIEDADEESEPFLASSLYTVSVGKPLMDSVSAVHVVRPGDDVNRSNRVEIDIADYEDYFLIEIPMSAFIGPGNWIVVIQP